MKNPQFCKAYPKKSPCLIYQLGRNFEMTGRKLFSQNSTFGYVQKRRFVYSATCEKGGAGNGNRVSYQTRYVPDMRCPGPPNALVSTLSLHKQRQPYST